MAFFYSKKLYLIDNSIKEVEITNLVTIITNMHTIV